jgi:hypothetical protein
MASQAGRKFFLQPTVKLDRDICCLCTLPPLKLPAGAVAVATELLLLLFFALFTM